jgi:hypothetical protein
MRYTLATMLNLTGTLSGSVPLKTLRHDEAVLGSVEGLLGREGLPVTERGPNFVEFKRLSWGEFSTANKWPTLAIYSQGRFEIENTSYGRRLRYVLRSPGLLLFCLIGGCVRDALTESLARVGFGTNYELTADGRLIDDLIDKLFVP